MATEVTKEADRIKGGQASVALARALFRQIESKNGECAFWVISAFDKLRRGARVKSMTCVANIMKQEMPQAYQDYLDYLRTT